MRTDERRARSKTVVVAGATGRLGGLVEVLLSRGHRVRALTRDPHSARARRLSELGAETRLADFDDPGSIARAARDGDVLFATGTAHRAGPEGELRHGLGVAEAAATAELDHLVYVSGDGAAADSPLPLFRAKFAVEARVAELGIPWTVLAPVYFMENLFNPWNLAPLRAGVLPSPIDVDQPMQQVAIADLLAVAAHAIESPEAFAGQRIAIASDELSASDAASAITALIGVELEPRRVPEHDLAPGLRALFAWLAEVGHGVDIDALKTRTPDVDWHTYSDWVSSQRERFRGLCPHRATTTP
jgi:uncharacterized protein YbjT (DUF2867 family)